LGPKKTIAIAANIPNNEIDKSFLIELFNSINPGIVKLDYNALLIKPTEILGQALIQISKTFSEELEVKEFWSVKQYNDLFGLSATNLKQYLEAQQEESLQCHGFSHTSQYQYHALKALQNHLEKIIQLKSLQALQDGLELSNEIQLLNNAFQEIKAYISNMESEAKFAKSFIENDNKKVIDFKKKEQHIKIRMTMLKEAVLLRKFAPKSGKITNLLLNFNMRDHEFSLHLPEEVRARAFAYSALDVYKTWFSLEEDETFLKEIQEVTCKLTI